uniref:Uncharacterized protein n=1 Tax=Anser brachyrhynchus TaxID=132585 RepID=A0A8B9BB18_9AVES
MEQLTRAIFASHLLPWVILEIAQPQFLSGRRLTENKGDEDGNSHNPNQKNSPMFYCPISQVHSDGEIAKIRKECRKESFWYRACLSPRD